MRKKKNLYLNPTRPKNETAVQMLKTGYLIRKYKKMIYRVAFKILTQHPNEKFDELVSEGLHEIVRTIHRYDPDQAMLSTWIYRCCWGAMKNYCLNQKVQRHIPHENSDPVFQELQNKENWIGTFLQELGEDAQALVQYIFEAQEELAHILNETAPKLAQRHLRKTFTHRLGRRRCELAFKEITQCLSTS